MGAATVLVSVAGEIGAVPAESAQTRPSKDLGGLATSREEAAAVGATTQSTERERGTPQTASRAETSMSPVPSHPATARRRGELRPSASGGDHSLQAGTLSYTLN